MLTTTFTDNADAFRCLLRLRHPKGRRTLHKKLQIIQLSSIHTTTVFYNSNDFFNNFIFGQTFLRKIFEFLCVVCEGL